MNKKLLVTAAALGLGASGAMAAPPPGGPLRMQGSDTLFDITNQLITACGISPVTTLTYIGTGSSNGGLEMRNGNQQVAPQSRFLSAAECTVTGGAANTGQGLQIGLDGIAVFRDTTEGSTCTTLRYAGRMPIQDLNNAAVLGYGNGAAGLDDGTGVALVDNPATANCNEAVEYCFTHWADVLRIVYNGQHAHLNDSSSTAACTADLPTSATGASAMATKRCNHDVRRTLVENWSNMFDSANDDGAGGCTDSHCTRLKHAWRRDDRSGTTDAFLSIIGAPSLGGTFTVKSFCNGVENEDSDVIRRTCSAAATPASDTDTVCGSMPFANRRAPFGADGSPSGSAGSTPPTPPAAGSVGDLGLVLAISLPADTTLAYDNTLCASAGAGVFRLAQMDSAGLTAAQLCPDGRGRVGGQCYWPVYSSGARVNQFNCKARRNQRPGGVPFANMDGRQYNRVTRNPLNGALLQPNTVGAVADPRWSGPGDFRIHMAFSAPSQTATAYAQTHPTCQQTSATRQIGCLVQADPCSIGFAGLEARDTNSNAVETAIAGTNDALRMRAPLDSDTGETNAGDDTEVTPTTAAIQDLVQGSPANCNRFPLARILWLDASEGFGSAFPGTLPNITNVVTASDGSALTTRENDFVQCYANRTMMDPILTQHGFIPLPAGYPEASRLRSCP